jgi:hypothetical protein
VTGHAGLLAGLVGSLLAMSSAATAEPTKRECAAANETAQDLRRAGKLGEARAQLAACTATSCPGPVREDCAQRLKEVEAAIPTVIFEAKNAAGHDLSAVRVTMDGEPLLEKLTGTAVTLDPGEHHFAFEADGLRKFEDTVVLREGERDRRVQVVLEAAAPASHADQGSTPWMDPSTQRALGLSIGGAGAAGLVVGGIFGLVAKSTYDDALRNECGGNPTTCTSQGAQDWHSATSQATVSTVAFVGGGVLLGAAVLLYVTAPKANVAVEPTVGNRGGGVALSGSW